MGRCRVNLRHPCAFRDDVRDCTEYTGMGWAAAFRDDVRDCIELNWRHKGRRAQYTGMGWAAVLRVYLRHPLNVHVQPTQTDPSNDGNTFRHRSPRQPLLHLFTTNRLRPCTEQRLMSGCDPPSSGGILGWTGRPLAGVEKHRRPQVPGSPPELRY